eukprot:scaffold9766_cov268-Amphora_coffeaeformis.AAC.1
MSNPLPLAISYAAMYAVQSKGPAIIGALWGPDAQAAAVAQNVDDVQPDADVSILCGGYDAAHFDVTSNILHAAGMVAAVYAVVQAVMGLLGVVGGERRASMTSTVQWFLWVWPVYYLPAWVGHLWYQKDIPAVFTYGTTVRGWAAGEYCAFCDLLSGGIVNEPAELVPAAVMTLVFVFGMHQAMATASHLKKTK